MRWKIGTSKGSFIVLVGSDEFYNHARWPTLCLFFELVQCLKQRMWIFVFVIKDVDLIHIISQMWHLHM